MLLLFVVGMVFTLSIHSGARAPHKKRVADALDAARALTETEPAAALDTADALLRRYPALGDAHYRRGLALWKLQRNTEATDALDRAVELEPTSAVFLDERGVAAGTLGDDMHAYSFFRRAVAADPNFLRSRSNLAYSLLQLRRDAEARVQLQAALILDPTHHLSRTRLEQLDTVAGNTVSVPVAQVCCYCRRLKGFVSNRKKLGRAAPDSRRKSGYWRHRGSKHGGQRWRCAVAWRALRRRGRACTRALCRLHSASCATVVTLCRCKCAACCC